jgi:hypothetical protein
MKTLLPIAFATAAIMFAACEAKVNTTPGTTTEKTNTIVTPGSGGTKTENNTTVVAPNPAPSKTETNTSTTVSPGGVQQSTTTESK